VLTLKSLSRGEVDIARLAAEVAALRDHSEGAQKQLAAHKKNVGGVDRMEVEIACVATEGAALTHRTGVCCSSMLFPLASKLHSLMVAELPPLCKDKVFHILHRGVSTSSRVSAIDCRD
jgi:hypothetical protein